MIAQSERIVNIEPLRVLVTQCGTYGNRDDVELPNGQQPMPGALIAQHLEWMRRRNLADSTIGIRRRRLERFAATCSLLDAEPADVERFLDARQLSPKSTYDMLSHLGSFYRWAIDHGHLHRDPTAQVPRPRVRRNLPRPISTGDLHLALELAGPMMRAWLTLAAFGGFRCVEISRLEVDDLLFDDGLLRVRGKGDRERLVPMHAEIGRTLRTLQIPRRGRVFRRPRGGGYPAAQVSREISLYLDGAGVSATAHQLRHWFGTHVYRTSRDLRVTQELLGHASPTTTAIYAEWSREEGRRAIDGLSLEQHEQPNGQQSLLGDW